MRTILLACLLGFVTMVNAQGPERPRLVVGIMIDQMRWDYLYRYHDHFTAGGFRRLLGGGYSCENTMIPYAQTVTAAGHSSVYTGSTPAVNGIVGNEWWDKEKGRVVYCTEDEGVKIVGGTSASLPMSPKNLWVTTVCDELRLATNFKSKVIGVAIKDRGCILPSGHSANAAYWYDDKNGNWVSSTFYMPQLPAWVQKFNGRRLVDSFYSKAWTTLDPIAGYAQSTEDETAYEGKYDPAASVVFPHDLQYATGKDYNLIRATPFGNTLTLMFAKAALTEENLGHGAATDFLNVSLSSSDVVGHQFGPNSVEVEDVYRRLDKDLGDFFNLLDQKVGKGAYLLFLTADHAAAHSPGFLAAHRLPGKALPTHLAELNGALKNKYRINNAVLGTYVYQYYLNDKAIDSLQLNRDSIKRFVIDYLNNKPEVYLAYDTKNLLQTNLPTELKEKFLKGYNPKLAGDVQVILKPAYFYGNTTGTQHGLWYPYDSHIPLLFYGWKIKPGHLNREVYMTDIAPTVAALLHIQMPSGCIGKPIYELMP